MSRHSHVETGWGIAVSYDCDGCSHEIESDSGHGYEWPAIKVEGSYFCYGCLKTALKLGAIIARDEEHKEMILKGQRLEDWDEGNRIMTEKDEDRPFYFADGVKDHLLQTVS